MESPQDMFWGLKPKFLLDIVVNNSRIVGAKHEFYVRVTGLSALVLNVVLAYPWSTDHGIV